MVIDENNNKQEDMVNNEQGNYAGEQQEESWFAKNKAIVIGIGLLVAVVGMWALSNSNTQPANAGNTEAQDETNYFSQGWKFLDNKPNWKQLGAVTLFLVVARSINKRWEITKTIGSKVKEWWHTTKPKGAEVAKELPTAK